MVRDLARGSGRVVRDIADTPTGLLDSADRGDGLRDGVSADIDDTVEIQQQRVVALDQGG